MPKRGAARLYPRAAIAEVAIASYGLGLAKGTATDQAKLPAAAGDILIGVSLRSALADENITYQPMVPGVDVEVVVSEAIVAGALLAADVAGRFQTPAAASGQSQQLEALEAATGAGEVITARVLADVVVA